MIFVEYPDWLADYNQMIDVIANYLISKHNMALLSVNNGHMSLITIIDFDKCIVTNMMIDNREKLMAQLQKDYINLDSSIDPELRIFRWIVERSNVNHMLCITKSKMLDF